MASTYSTPGVYIQEISTLPASIAQVETAIPAFIGRTEEDPSGPRRITSMVDYVEIFGGSMEDVITIPIVADTDDPTKDAVGIAIENTTNSAKNLYYHMLMYFANGGGPCYVCSLGPTSGDIETSTVKSALDEIKLEDEPTLIVIPEAIHIADDGFYDSMQNALAQCNELQDRFVIMNTPDDTLSQATFRTKIGTQNLKYGAVYYPFLNTSLVYDDRAVRIAYTSGLDAGFLSDVHGKTLAEIMVQAAAATGSGNNFTKFLSLLEGDIRIRVAEQEIVLGAASSMAGVYASVDTWKTVRLLELKVCIDTKNYLYPPDQKFKTKCVYEESPFFILQ